MLILELHLGESVVLTEQQTGEQIAEVILSSVVQDHRGYKARLGFNAPHNIRILRKELLTKGLTKNHVEKEPT